MTRLLTSGQQPLRAGGPRPKMIPTYHRYLDPADRPLTRFVSVMTLGDFVASVGDDHHMHRHPALFQLAYITGGSGYHTIEEEEVTLEPDHLYLLRPNVIHSCRSKGLRGFILHFSPDCLPSALRPELDWRYQVVSSPTEDRQFLILLFQELARSIQTELAPVPHQPPKALTPQPPKVLTPHLLSLILLKAAGYRPTLAAPVLHDTTHHLIASFFRLLEVYYRFGRSGAWFAQRLAVSHQHLCSCVRAQTGKTVKQHLNERLLREARSRLRFETTAISEIAHDLGFGDVNYFRKFFRRHEGTTPTGYRKGPQ